MQRYIRSKTEEVPRKKYRIKITTQGTAEKAPYRKQRIETTTQKFLMYAKQHDPIKIEIAMEQAALLHRIVGHVSKQSLLYPNVPKNIFE